VNRSDQTAAIDGALAALAWIIEPTTAHNSRWEAVMSVLDDTALRATIAQGSTDNIGRRSIGDHSDPTATAVGPLLDAAILARKHRQKITRTLGSAASCALWLRTAGTATDDPLDPTPASVRDDLLRSTLTDHPDTNEILSRLFDDCRLLAELIAAELRDAVARKPEPVEQPKLTTCACCTEWGYREPVVKRGLCEVCAAFRADHKCWPTKSIRDDRALGRRRIRQAQLDEAKAAYPRRRRRSA